MREHLAALDGAAFGEASCEPKFISRSDPRAYKRTFIAYAANDLIDADHGVIVYVEAT